MAIASTQANTGQEAVEHLSWKSPKDSFCLFRHEAVGSVTGYLSAQESLMKPALLFLHVGFTKCPYGCSVHLYRIIEVSVDPSGP
jgi:hypothetical protein